MSGNHQQKLQRNISLFYVSQFLEGLLFIIPIWVAYQRQYLNFTQMALASSLRLFLVALLELPTGVFADLVGRKISVMLGYLIDCSGLVLIAIPSNPINIIFGMALRGIGEAFISGSNEALLYDSLKELKAESTFSKIKGKIGLFYQWAIVISSILGGYMFVISPQLPWLIYAVCMMVNSLIYFVLIKEPKIDTQKFSLKNYVLQTKIGVRETYKTSYIKNLSIFYALVGGFSWAWQIYFNQIFASEIGYTEIGKGWLFAIIRLINSLLILKLLNIKNLVNKRNVFLFFPGLILLSSLPILLANQALGTFLLFLMTLASTTRFVLLDKYTNEVFSSKYRATALSTLNLYVSLVYLVLVGISGPIIDHWNVKIVYFLVGLISLVTILPRGLALAKNHIKDQS